MFYTYFPLENLNQVSSKPGGVCVSAFGYLNFKYDFYNKFCFLVYHFHDIALKFPILSF